MEAVRNTPMASLFESNPYNGFYSMKVGRQDELLKKQYDRGLLSFDPRKGFAIISISGRSKGMMLNPIDSRGLLLFFVNLDLAKQFVEAKKVQFEKSQTPMDDIEIGKWCPADRCSCH